MKYLFVHQNFPGQYLHFVRRLAAQGQHDVVFISAPNENQIRGVQKLVYRLPSLEKFATPPDAQEFAVASLRAQAVARLAAELARLGFTPDVIIGHHGWGELLNIRDVWPDAPLLGYFEFYYHTAGIDVGFDPEFPVDPALFSRIRAKNAVNLLALTMPGEGQTPTRWQRSTFPPWAASRLTLAPEGVDLGVCRPDPAARDHPFVLGDVAIGRATKLVTYVARNLEPYRGFHTMMRTLPRVLAARPDVEVVLVGADGVSYGMHPPRGTWRERLLGELAGKLDLARVHFPGKIAYQSYVRLLQRTDVHVYLTYPFVASWSLREALAIGVPIVASATPPVAEFVTDGENGLLTPCLDPARLADHILELLEDRALAERLGAAARAYAEGHLGLAQHLRSYESLIRRLVAGGAGN